MEEISLNATGDEDFYFAARARGFDQSSLFWRSAKTGPFREQQSRKSLL